MSGLVHRVREAEGEPDGALVLLHGRGADEHDLHPLLDALDPERRLTGLTPGAPLTNVPPGGRHWYLVPRVGFPDPQTFHAAREALWAFLDGWLAERGIGWDRTAIGGFSMGAVMSFTTALAPGRPEPAALVALSGFIPTVEGWTPDLSRRVPAFIHHGRADPIIGVDFGRRAAQALPHAAYLETDAGHYVPPEAIGPAAELIRRSTS
jgi:phospholipase/carboxylesterase